MTTNDIIEVMIFGLKTDDHGLEVFADEAAVIGDAEGVDVEDGVWAFFAEDGSPLEAVFTIPNERDWLGVASGEYYLRPDASGAKSLLDRIDEVAYVEGPPGLNSLTELRRHLDQRQARSD